MLKAVRGLALASHPGPALVVTIVTVLLGVAVGYTGALLVVLGAAMLADQLSVGWSNDWIDADRDRKVGRHDKPIATGMIGRRAVAIAAIAALVAALLLTVPLGPAAVIAHTVAVLSAWSYNAWLKRTIVSVLPYMVGFGLLPAIVTLGLPQPAWPAWWVIVTGCLLGAAAHLTNVLPDLDDDRATGVRGLGHIIGGRASALLSFVLLGAAGVCVGVGAVLVGGLAGTTAVVVITGAAITVLIAVFGVVLALRGVRSRWLMRLIMASAVLIVVALVAAGPVLSV